MFREGRNPFAGRLGRARVSFQLPDQVVWGASVIQGDDGRYHMFASVWPANRGSWVTDSVVVLASADRPEGPYHYEMDVLPPRGRDHWDGMMSHNPSIQRHNGTYYLFYTGTTYTQPRPTAPLSPHEDPIYKEAWDNKRIGVAMAEHPRGPWHRLDKPIIEPRPGNWDAVITSNAAPVIHTDGSVTLIYKSTDTSHPGPDTPPLERPFWQTLTIGAAKAKSPEGPYVRVGDHDGLIHIEGEPRVTEDAYAWFTDGWYHMVVKTFDTSMIDEANAGVYVVSRDASDWAFPVGGPKAYSRTVTWEDGTTTELQRLERPQVLLQDGRPAYLFLSARFPSDRPAPNNGIPFNVVIPVER
ncbi:MAG: glycoside hydrolase family protein [Anaerolineae bacterium]|nr:glycoside hydrolase family protein [Anaerolineae bacterium]